MPRKQQSFATYTRRAGECLLWTGAKNSTGYGSYRFGGKPRKAHHVAYELANGPLPKSRAGHQDFVVMHTCDNRLCVNPKHLILGTQGENFRDAIAKDRLPQLAAIRLSRRQFDYEAAAKMRAAGMTFQQIADEFGVWPRTVHRGLKRSGC
jgi:DNA-binding CsgD family transcriptional regulator